MDRDDPKARDFPASAGILLGVGLGGFVDGPHPRWNARLLIATMLVGFGGFNLVEGLVDHQWLGIHHVNETVPREPWLWWDLGFLAWGAAMLVGGLALWRSARRNDARVGAAAGGRGSDSDGSRSGAGAMSPRSHP